MTHRWPDALLEGICFENQPVARAYELRCYEDSAGGRWGSVALSVGQGMCKGNCCVTRVFKGLTDLGEAKKVFLFCYSEIDVQYILKLG